MTKNICLLSLTWLAGEMHSKIIHYDQKLNHLHMLTHTMVNTEEKTSMIGVPTIIIGTVFSKNLYLFVLTGAAVLNQRVKSGSQQQVSWDKSATQAWIPHPVKAKHLERNLELMIWNHALPLWQAILTFIP